MPCQNSHIIVGRGRISRACTTKVRSSIRGARYAASPCRTKRLHSVRLASWHAIATPLGTWRTSIAEGLSGPRFTSSNVIGPVHCRAALRLSSGEVVPPTSVRRHQHGQPDQFRSYDAESRRIERRKKRSLQCICVSKMAFYRSGSSACFRRAPNMAS